MLYLKCGGVTFCHLFRFLSVHTVSIFGHIARYAPSSADTLPSKEIRNRYAPSSADTLPSKEIRKSVKANL